MDRAASSVKRTPRHTISWCELWDFKFRFTTIRELLAVKMSDRPDRRTRPSIVPIHVYCIYHIVSLKKYLGQGRTI
jgi:hypothetical protein